MAVLELSSFTVNIKPFPRDEAEAYVQDLYKYLMAGGEWLVGLIDDGSKAPPTLEYKTRVNRIIEKAIGKEDFERLAGVGDYCKVLEAVWEINECEALIKFFGLGVKILKMGMLTAQNNLNSSESA